MNKGPFSQYSEKVMDHFHHPRNVGVIENPDGIGHVGNPICGDIMELYIKVKNDVIVDAKFKTFGCLPPNEEIVFSRGNWEKILSVTKGDKVLNSDGESTEAVETYISDYKGYLIKIYPFVSPFNAFVVTPNHPILSIKRRNLKKARRSSRKCTWLRVDKEELLSAPFEFVRAGNLNPSDYLVYTVNQEVRDNQLYSSEIMRLIGYYLAEGYICANNSVVAFGFNKKEKDLIKEVEKLIYNFCKKEAKKRVRGNVAEVYVCSRKLANFLKKAGGVKARFKFINQEIMLLPFEKQWQMIETYHAGDGDSYRRRPKDHLTYRIITTSRNLAVQIQEILARGIIFSSIRSIYKTNCYIEGRKLKNSLQYLMSFKLKRKHKFVHNNGKYFLIPVKKMEKLPYHGKVYNFQVMGEPNTYLVKGFAVHNCGAAIATSSMVTELVKGKTIKEALKISNRAVAEALGGLPPIKIHCSMLAEEALKKAIEDYLSKKKHNMGSKSGDR